MVANRFGLHPHIYIIIKNTQVDELHQEELIYEEKVRMYCEEPWQLKMKAVKCSQEYKPIKLLNKETVVSRGWEHSSAANVAN